MGKATGFLELERIEEGYEAPTSRLKHYKEFVIGLAPEQASAQAARCMDCGIPFCNNGCPVNNIIPDFNDLVYRHQWQAALEVLHSTNNFPEFTGRICPAPCEAACTLNYNDDAVGIKSIEHAIIDRGWAEGWVVPRPAAQKTGRRVAVVGSGPAGLAAAQQLARAGHTVAVFERADRIGGLLRYGIPEFKMEKRHLDRRLTQMAAEGVKFRPGVEVGIDITGQDLRQRYDAVVVAVGATQWRDLEVPGRELTGIYQAMEFLPLANRVQEGDFEQAPIDVAGKHVVILGGGDTGADCLGTSHRQGAASVTQLEIMPTPPESRPEGQPWPTYPMTYRVSSAHEEGGERVFAVSTERFLDDGHGNVRALELVEVEAHEGGFRPVEGSRREIPADVVFLAMGFVGPEAGSISEQLGLPVTDRGALAREADYSTPVPGVFVAGDAGRGQSLIVWAIAEGRAAAASVDAFLMGTTNLPSPIPSTARQLLV